MKQVEVVVFGPAAGRDSEHERRPLGLRHRDDQPEEAGRGGPARLVDGAVVALDDLLQRERKRFTVRLERLVLPTSEGLGRDLGAGPGEIEVRAPAGGLERDPQLADPLALQPGRDRDDRSHERVAVDLSQTAGSTASWTVESPRVLSIREAAAETRSAPSMSSSSHSVLSDARSGASGRWCPRAPPPPRG